MHAHHNNHPLSPGTNVRGIIFEGARDRSISSINNAHADLNGWDSEASGSIFDTQPVRWVSYHARERYTGLRGRCCCCRRRRRGCRPVPRFLTYACRGSSRWTHRGKGDVVYTWPTLPVPGSAAFACALTTAWRGKIMQRRTWDGIQADPTVYVRMRGMKGGEGWGCCGITALRIFMLRTGVTVPWRPWMTQPV